MAALFRLQQIVFFYLISVAGFPCFHSLPLCISKCDFAVVSTMIAVRTDSSVSLRNIAFVANVLLNQNGNKPYIEEKLRYNG